MTSRSNFEVTSEKCLKSSIVPQSLSKIAKTSKKIQQSIETNENDLIEELFSRLNEAVPLNAPEKRNAFGGVVAKSIRDLAKHSFFKNLAVVKTP